MRSAILLSLVLLALPAGAHNVVGGVYAVGSSIEGEVGFSNGDMAKAGTPVQVFDGAGNRLGETEIDAEGLFVFTARQRIDHRFHADLSAGHVLDLVLPAEELPASLPGAEPVAVAEVVSAAAVAVTGADQTQLELLIEQAVARQVKPLRKELAAYKEKANLQDLLGGIGYIFGLCGLGIWLRQRQKDKQRASVS